MRIRLERAHFMPARLEPGVLYVCEEFGTAAHLCACGCGAKVRTPLGPAEWTLKETRQGPSLRPSIGNWQEACRSHYWIRAGQIIWLDPFTQEEALAGRIMEQERRERYYETLNRGGGWRGILRGLSMWFRRLFKRP